VHADVQFAVSQQQGTLLGKNARAAADVSFGRSSRSAEDGASEAELESSSNTGFDLWEEDEDQDRGGTPVSDGSGADVSDDGFEGSVGGGRESRDDAGGSRIDQMYERLNVNAALSPTHVDKMLAPALGLDGEAERASLAGGYIGVHHIGGAEGESSYKGAGANAKDASAAVYAEPKLWEKPRWIKLWKNGDVNFAAQKLLVGGRDVATFDALLDRTSKLLKTPVYRLYGQTGKRLTSLHQVSGVGGEGQVSHSSFVWKAHRHTLSEGATWLISPPSLSTSLSLSPSSHHSLFLFNLRVLGRKGLITYVPYFSI
jgi:hypothetical protein